MASNSAEQVPVAPDLISTLPPPLLIEIISRLPADEAVRTGILSRPWRGLWRYTNRFEFDPKKMMKPSKQARFREQMISHRLGINSGDVKKDISRAVSAMNKVLWSHKCNLISCKIIHYPESFRNGQLEKWIKYLLAEKKVQELALTFEDFSDFMSRYPDPKLCLSSGIFSGTTLHALELTDYKFLSDYSPFDHCHNMKTLKMKRLFLSSETLEGIISSCACLEHLSLSACTGLKQVRVVSESVKIVELEFLIVSKINLTTKSLDVLMLDSLKCPAKSMFICAPKLREFRAYSNSEDAPCPTKLERDPDKLHLQVSEILEQYSGLIRCESLFKILLKLSIDLRLNSIREVLILSYILQVCTHLQQLQINILEMESEAKGETSDHGSLLPYPESMLWDIRELSDCVTHTLSQVSLKGFQGKEREMEFVRHLITRATVMKRINICCKDSCSREGAEATLGLLSLPRSSFDVSIVLKPGPAFASAEVSTANFERWILTLK